MRALKTWFFAASANDQNYPRPVPVNAQAEMLSPPVSYLCRVRPWPWTEWSVPFFSAPCQKG